MIMKKYLLAIATAAAAMTASAQDPVAISMATNIYSYYGASNHFSLVLGATEPTYVDVDCGFGTVEYLVEPAVWDPETESVKGTVVSCQVNPDAKVTIYGDASKIDYLDAEGCYLSSIDLGDCENLDVLNLQHNELQALDLSKYTKLSSIYLTDNPFTAATPLVVGKNHPNLMILEVDIIDHISPDFDIDTYPELISFDAYATKSLSKLTPSGCPKLARLSVDMCAVSELDVTKNHELLVLNIEDTRIRSIDLSGCPKLQQFYCRNASGSVNTDVKISSLDLSHNPALTYLSAGSNLLTSLDLSKNPALTFINVCYNNLASINLDGITETSTLNLTGNRFGFSTLPLPSEAYGDYTYDQQPLPAARSYAAGTVLDFSSMVLREGTTTDAVLYAYSTTSDAAEPLDDSYYSYADGKLTLLKEYTDSVYVSFGNSSFPDARLQTALFMVKNAADYGKPSAIIDMNPAVGSGTRIAFGVGIDGATAAAPRTFYVDCGDGVLQEFKATAPTADAANVEFNRKGYGHVTVYAAEGDVVTAFSISGTRLSNIDLTKATELRSLSVTDAHLTDIDLAYNRCLQSLVLDRNEFRNLTLEGVNGGYGKNVLSAISVADNLLTDITLNDTRTILYLDLSGNKIAEFTYKDFDNLLWLDLSDNQLSDLDMTYLTQTRYINLSGNRFSALTLPDPLGASELHLENNLFTLQTLPYIAPAAAVKYVYAPQAEVVLPTRGPGVNLSDQNRVIDGKGTSYTWYTEAGKALVAGTDYTIQDGLTKFVNTGVGKIYCVMTNPAFPAFTGANEFRTTLIKADGMPTNLLATFVTAEDGESVGLSLAAEKLGTALYIDWDGTGDVFEQYLLADTYRLFSATTRANATVKVYTYEPSEHITVFSMSGATLKSMDASGMVDLICFSVNGAGLSEFGFPKAAALRELSLEDNALSSFDPTVFPKLTTLGLNGNKLTTLDVTPLTDLQILAASRNQLDHIVFGPKPNLWMLLLSDNNFESISLNGLRSLEQLAVSNNNLTTLDVTPCPSLNMLQVDGNRFTFNTLPSISKKYYSYTYVNQQPIEAVEVGDCVDLSQVASCGDVQSVFRWFIGVPTIDENEELAGEELVEGEEYTVKNGVTTFYNNFENVMCVVTNTEFPKLYIYTVPMNVTSGVTDVAADGAHSFTARAAGNGLVVVTTDLADGTAVVLTTPDGRSVATAAVADGRAELRGPAGFAVVSCGGEVAKIIVR